MEGTMDIDREKLRALASAPNGTLKSICAGLGISDPTLYLEFKKDPSLRKLYDDAREAASLAGWSKAPKHTNHKPRRKYKKRTSGKASPGAAPPRNGHAKQGLDPDLIKQLVAEFHFIDAWGEVSDHFDELRGKVLALA